MSRLVPPRRAVPRRAFSHVRAYAFGQAWLGQGQDGLFFLLVLFFFFFLSPREGETKPQLK